MRHYSVKVHVRPELRYSSLLGGTGLSEGLTRGLEGVVISHSQPAPLGGDHLWLELSRPADHELLAELQAAATEVGYALVEAEVETFVDKAVQGALIGLCGGGAAGSKTRNPLLALIAAAIGGYLGEKAGAELRTLVGRHRYQLHRNGQWIVTELPTVAAEQPVPQGEPVAFFSA